MAGAHNPAVLAHVAGLIPMKSPCQSAANENLPVSTSSRPPVPPGFKSVDATPPLSDNRVCVTGDKEAD